VLTRLEGRSHEIPGETFIVFVHVHLGHGELELGEGSSVRVLGRVIHQEQDLNGDMLDDFTIY
jgi:hypothetical protein